MQGKPGGHLLLVPGAQEPAEPPRAGEHQAAVFKVAVAVEPDLKKTEKHQKVVHSCVLLPSASLQSFFRCELGSRVQAVAAALAAAGRQRLCGGGAHHGRTLSGTADPGIAGGRRGRQPVRGQRSD